MDIAATAAAIVDATGSLDRVNLSMALVKQRQQTEQAAVGLLDQAVEMAKQGNTQASGRLVDIEA